MAHEIFIDVRGKASMAYVEDEPWHGLGQQLTRGASLDVWAREAGMGFKIQDAPALYRWGGKLLPVETRKHLVRDDTGAVLGTVGSKYKVVQPCEVLEFFRGLTEKGGFALETAGVLFGGAKYWALAKTGHDARIGAKGSKDVVRGYLLLATSCDGTLQTTAQFTSVRVVCNNTLRAATLDSSDKIGAIKVSHRSEFDAQDVRGRLGLDRGWTEFVEAANVLARIKLNDKQASEFVVKLLQDASARAKATEADKMLATKQAATILQLYAGKGRGSEMASSQGTAWGLVNAVTETVDHLQGKDQSNRLYQAWFHAGNELKRDAFDRALALA